MNPMHFHLIPVLLCLWTVMTPSFASAEAERVSGTPGNLRIHYFPIPAEATNPWPATLEEEFWKRANHVISHSKVDKYGGLFFESEKSSYPKAFIDFLKGNREKSLKFLQDNDGDPHAVKATLSVDWYPSFTIKSQVRKYFFFGQYLDPAYRKRMFDSAKIWTEVDPLNRPNDFYKGNKDGWNVDAKNSWVDVRNTDNLRAMRECSVYLMAEETGNTKTAALYKDRIRAYATALYMTGMGEWDSANYFHHGTTAWFQLYDYAKDPEVRMLGKAVLDWICTAAAVKYHRGNWAGPNKRDYNNLPIFVGAPGSFWLYFGATPGSPEDPDHDLVHWFTSPYRPPEAVVALARKEFALPVEILASKPSYDGWYRKPGGDEVPSFYETTYISREFQIGTLAGGHEGDTCGFRMATSNPAIGSDIWVLGTALKGYVGGIATATAGGDRIAQSRNLLIYANARGDVPFHFLVPKPLEAETRNGVTFLKSHGTWVAVTPVGTEVTGIDDAATQEVCTGKRPMPDNQIWTARGNGSGPAALILEIGDASSHPDYESFRKAVLDRSVADLSRLKDGEIHYTGSTGGRVGLRLQEGGLPLVFREGTAHDWKNHQAQFTSTEKSASRPISLGWKEGRLHVEAGGKTFTGWMENGKYHFKNQ